MYFCVLFCAISFLLLLYLTAVKKRSTEGGCLQQFNCNAGAGLGIGQRVMVVLKAIAASLGYSLELVVGQITQFAAGGAERIIEPVIRVIHLIDAEHGFQAAFIKRAVVGHKRKSLYERLYLCPDLREHRRIISIGTAQTVDLLAPVVVVVGLRLDKRVERIRNLTVTHNDYAYRAHR